MKGHRRVLKVLFETPVGVDQDFLNDITCVDATTNSLVQPHCDHPSQRIAVAVK